MSTGFAPGAIADLDEIWDYTASTWSEAQAERKSTPAISWCGKPNQPFARSGELLCIGLQHSADFRWLEPSDFDPIQRQIWRVYVEIQK